MPIPAAMAASVPLASLAPLLEDWRKYWLIALDCINQLRPLAQLQAGPQQTALKQRRAAEQLMKTAPSAGLALLTARQETAPAANLTDLQSEYMILQEAVRELSACLAGMHAVYSRTLTELQTSPQSDTAQSMEGHDELDVTLEGDAAIDSAEPRTEPASQDTQTAASDRASAAASAVPDMSTPELLVLLGKACEGYRKQLDMVVAISGSLCLTTPSEVLDTYAFMLELEPYVDERLVSVLWQHAHAAVKAT